LGELRKLLGIVALVGAPPVWATGDLCVDGLTTAGMRLFAARPFLQDVARYLTGNADDAETVYLAYKRRVTPGDPALPYPLHPPAIPIPDTLEAMWTQLGLDTEAFPAAGDHRWQPAASKRWARRLIKNSRVKGTGRMIYRRKGKAGEARVSIAQTWSGTAGAARETEIAVQRTGSQDWDFFVYDEAGKLAASSKFHTAAHTDVDGPAPLTCLACHYDRTARVFTYAPMSFTDSERLALILP
jgi:hypothetical protein